MKRFYTSVTVAQSDNGWQVELDGRPVKTPRGSLQTVPTRALAQSLAAEWHAQGDDVDTGLFRFRDLTDFSIDMIASGGTDTHDTLLSFLDTDTLCYRADADEPFYKRQIAVWEPILTRFEARYGVELKRISGIIHQQQPPATFAILRTVLAPLDPFTLSALLTKTSLAASLTIGVSTLEIGADVEALWAAANLEEDWQIEQWGSDAEAEARRAKRHADFITAHMFGQLLSNGSPQPVAEG